MIHLLHFAAESATEEATGIGALGVSPSAFVVQLVTFLLVFLLLKKFALARITKMLENRRKIIEDGIKLGEVMQKEKANLDEAAEKVIRDARHEGDRIIQNAQKDARGIVHEAEKAGQNRVNTMVKEAEERITEETEHARRRLEKDIVGLISEATETIIEEKVDERKDAELIDRAINNNRKK